MEGCPGRHQSHPPHVVDGACGKTAHLLPTLNLLPPSTRSSAYPHPRCYFDARAPHSPPFLPGKESAPPLRCPHPRDGRHPHHLTSSVANSRWRALPLLLLLHRRRVAQTLPTCCSVGRPCSSTASAPPSTLSLSPTASSDCPRSRPPPPPPSHVQRRELAMAGGCPSSSSIVVVWHGRCLPAVSRGDHAPRRRPRLPLRRRSRLLLRRAARGHGPLLQIHGADHEALSGRGGWRGPAHRGARREARQGVELHRRGHCFPRLRHQLPSDLPRHHRCHP
jgi:hypothetical protein